MEGSERNLPASDLLPKWLRMAMVGPGQDPKSRFLTWVIEPQA